MKILRWIMGIVVPYALVAGVVEAISALQDSALLKFTYSNSYMYFAFLAFKEFIVFFLLAFLSCVIIPAPKKYAAITSIILNVVILIGVTVAVFIYGSDESLVPSAQVLVVDLVSSVIGLATGIALAYAIFKNRGWDSPKPVIEFESAEQY
jgi:hypothetical protein